MHTNTEFPPYVEKRFLEVRVHDLPYTQPGVVPHINFYVIIKRDWNAVKLYDELMGKMTHKYPSQPDAVRLDARPYSASHPISEWILKMRFKSH